VVPLSSKQEVDVAQISLPLWWGCEILGEEEEDDDGPNFCVPLALIQPLFYSSQQSLFVVCLLL
jgi:hypothetical protein